jgi:acid phosphatase (class A)
MKHQIFALFFLILSACSATTEKYFAGNSIPPTLIEPPFANNSKEQQDEIQQIIKLQKNFNLNELELASREKYLRPEIFVLYVDRSLTRESYPYLYQLLDRTSATTKAANDNAKEYWNITRPYIDKKVNMLITPSQGPSYPSGHASNSSVSAQIIGLLIPQKSSDLQKLAKKIAQRRVLVGMHYPHDIVAGEQLSRIVLGGLMQNKEFQKDFEKARSELEKNPPKNLAVKDGSTVQNTNAVLQ